MSGESKKRKNKGYYASNTKKQKKDESKFGPGRAQLNPNMNGFLITYNSKFTFCINEAKKILQQFVEKNNKTQNDEIDKNKSESTDDFDKQLKEELAELKSEDNEYKIIDAGAKYTLFISIPNTNVNKTSENIYEYIKQTKKQLCRYVQRFVPILNTCKSYNEDIEKCIEKTFNQIYNPSDTIKYTCIFKSSNNTTLKRDDIIKIVNKYFQNKNNNNKVDYDTPDFVVLIQVIRNMCFISYLKDYFNYRKYNLVEMGIKYSSELTSETETKKVKLVENKESNDLDDKNIETECLENIKNENN